MAMPPPPGFPPQGQVMDPYPQFDVPGGYDSDDYGDQGLQRNNSNKKNKDKDKKKTPVEVQYEGFMLEKAAPQQIGERPSWSRIGRRTLPFSDSKFVEICRKVRLETRMGPLNTLARLSGDQQGVINRLIAQRQLEEKNKDAEWVLECVKRYTEKHWRTRTIEVVKIMVILKRQDRNAIKSATTSQRIGATGRVNQYQQSEIIDLATPMKDKKKDKNKKNNNVDRDDDPWDEPRSGNNAIHDPFADVGHGHRNSTPIVDVFPQPQHHQGHHGQPHHNQGHHEQIPPMGAIPIPMNQFPPPPMQPQQQFGGPMPHEGNPFQPNPQFNHPGAFEMPRDMDPHRQNHFQARATTPHGGQRRDSHSRSRSREAEEQRRRELQRRDSERLERKFDQLEDRLGDRLDEVINKVEDWNLREGNSSSEGSFRDRDDMWSAQSGGSFTPPSTPPRTPLMMDGPNGTLGRRGSKYYRRDSGYVGTTYPRDHRRSAGQIVMEPYNNHSSRRLDDGRGHVRRRSDATGLGLRIPNAPSPPRRHATTRPLLHHGNTWSGRERDDYPGGPYAEPVLRRGITQFPAEDYGVADFGRGGRRRERERGYVDERRGGRRAERERGYVY